MQVPPTSPECVPVNAEDISSWNCVPTEAYRRRCGKPAVPHVHDVRCRESHLQYVVFYVPLVDGGYGRNVVEYVESALRGVREPVIGEKNIGREGSGNGSGT